MTLNRVDRPDTIALALQIAAQLPPCHADALEALAFGREDCLPGAHRADAAVGRPMRSASMPKPGARRHRSSFPRVISPLRGPARRRTDPAERPSTFYRLWTLKEAFLKATAQDLAAQLDSFFGLDPVAIAVAAPESASAWHFVEFRPGPAHSLALAAQSPGPISVDAAAVSARECLGHSDGELRWSYGALPEEPIRDYCPGKESANRNPFESDEIDYRVLVIPEGQPFALASFRTSRRE
jgi:hypothetical protein